MKFGTTSRGEPFLPLQFDSAMPEHARRSLIERLTPRYGEGEARAIARIVFEDVFDHGRRFDATLFNTISIRLEAGEPLQYVLGKADFFGLKFSVNPAVLIPRQETEELVAWVLETLRANTAAVPAPVLLDIGAGSGCIGITLKKKFPALQLFGLEKSGDALACARQNATQLLGADTANWVQGDILLQNDWSAFPSLDYVVSNPPYIPVSERTLVPEHVAAHEPALALFVDDEDPLLFYRVIADFAQKKLRTGGRLFFECNQFNAGEVASLLRQKGFSGVELRRDLAGADRMVGATWQK